MLQPHETVAPNSSRKTTLRKQETPGEVVSSPTPAPPWLTYEESLRPAWAAEGDPVKREKVEKEKEDQKELSRGV